MLIPFATHAFLSAGSSSWVDALNTGIATYKPPTSKAANPVKVPKVGVNCGTVPTTLPAHKPGRKQHKAILADNPPEQEAAFYPAPGIDREAEKDRLSALVSTACASQCRVIACIVAAGAEQYTGAKHALLIAFLHINCLPKFQQQ